MGFFKTKRDVVEFSRNFYEVYVYGSNLPRRGEFDAVSVFTEVVHRKVCEVDPSFAAVPIPKLRQELLALRFEMIGTAWTHKSDEIAAITNSEFTKSYLVPRHF